MGNTMSSADDYTKMQEDYYESEAARWTPENRDPVVGSFDAHNEWADYGIMFDGLDTKKMDALDFGCGPGRAIKLWRCRFNRIDGMDISKTNLKNAKEYLGGSQAKDASLFFNNGKDCRPVFDNTYDLVYSIICLQHIAVHEIRFSIMKDIYRVLNVGGHFCFQLGGGGKTGHPWVLWNDNEYGASGTNGSCDVSVTNIDDVILDLERIGFKNVSVHKRATGPGDAHKYWLFVRAEK
jgi:SAM-dependent methyltransferase